jgi:hypothetical protein
MYTTDNWVILKIKGDDPHYRVLAGWSGGYTTGDSWRMNSGITKVEETENSYLFYGSSGSCYKCRKSSYTLRMNNAHQHGDKIELMYNDSRKTRKIIWSA